jgi:hypothetical protein
MMQREMIMMKRTGPLVGALLFLCFALLSVHSDGRASAMEETPQLTPSQELVEIFRADQGERENFTKLKPDEILTLRERDRARRERVAALINTGSLRSAEDYYYAAMIYQHGETPDDYLTAHILATVAGFKGHQAARWLSAASLDRYLVSKQGHQVFNTQFIIDGTGKWQLRPHHALVPDGIIQEYGAKTMKETEKYLEERNEGPPKANP